MDASSTEPQDYTELTVHVVSAYVANNRVGIAELPALIANTYAALSKLGGPATPSATPEPEIDKPTPAQVRKSVTPDAIISFIDGKPYKTIKRHLGTHGLSFEQYRARYGLPRDYPSVAASYAQSRSALAKSIGLGRGGRKGAAAAETAPDLEPAEKPKRATRPRKAKASV